MNNGTKKNGNINMYREDSTFISLTGDTNTDTKKVDAAVRTLNVIYTVHEQVNELWEKDEKLKEVKAAIAKSKKIIRVSSDIHGDINCLIFNLKNIIKLKEDNFLVVDPTNGETIFDGSIDDIKSDLEKGEESKIKKALAQNKEEEDENNIVLLPDFDIREDFDPAKGINVFTGDHIDRGPHSTEVLCMELQVKKKLEEKFKFIDHENELINENKINENDDDKEILEGKNNLVLTIGDHETGCNGTNNGDEPDENESVANLLAKKMITDGTFVPAYLYKSENGNIISHSHVMFLIQHVFQVFRQIDELEKLLALEKDIDNENFFDEHKDNEFVQILSHYGESDKRGKIILKSLIKTYQKVLENKEYEKILNKIGIVGKSKEFVNGVRAIIKKHGTNFYKSWKSCVKAGYDFYKEVGERLNLSTEDFFMLRNFAMDVFSRPIASDTETKNELLKIYNFDSDSLLDCFADYFSNANKGFWLEEKRASKLKVKPFKIDSCLVSLRIIKFGKNDGHAPNIYWERRLDGKQDGKWNIYMTGEVKSEKLVFPGASQIIGHDRVLDHKIQFYDKSIINNDPASSIGYDEGECQCYPNEIIYDPEKPGEAYNITFKVTDLNNPSITRVVVSKVKRIELGYYTKEELEKAIHEDENEKEIENNENKTSGIYLMKWILIILGLLLIAGGIALFFVAPTLAFKILAIGLGILGVAGFGFGLFYNKIGNYYRKKPESCCFCFWTYTIFRSKEQTQEKDINPKGKGKNSVDEEKNVF